MLDTTQGSGTQIAAGVEAWLTQFEQAVADAHALMSLFQPDSYWRDVLALSWRIKTLNGRDAILKDLPGDAQRAGPGHFVVAPDRAAPRWVMRAGTRSIEAIFNFETHQGRGSGIVRLIPDPGDGERLKA